jgi:hypothetical protein
MPTPISAPIPDGSFDYAVLQPDRCRPSPFDVILSESGLRIGQQALQASNFAHWRGRSLFFGGRMPVTRLLPASWWRHAQYPPR